MQFGTSKNPFPPTKEKLSPEMVLYFKEREIKELKEQKRVMLEALRKCQRPAYEFGGQPLLNEIHEAIRQAESK